MLLELINFKYRIPIQIKISYLRNHFLIFLLVSSKHSSIEAFYYHFHNRQPTFDFSRRYDVTIVFFLIINTFMHENSPNHYQFHLMSYQTNATPNFNNSASLKIFYLVDFYKSSITRPNLPTRKWRVHCLYSLWSF